MLPIRKALNGWLASNGARIGLAGAIGAIFIGYLTTKASILLDGVLLYTWKLMAQSGLIFGAGMVTGGLMSYMIVKSVNRPRFRQLQSRLDLDDQMLTFVPGLASINSPADELGQVVKRFLDQCDRIFGSDFDRAYVSRPDESGQWLVPRETHHMPDDSLEGVRFYIGDDSKHLKDRGVAGNTWKDGCLRITTIDKDGRADDDAYVKFQQNPKYVTFASVPLLWKEERLGVLCIDSKTRNAFAGTEELLLRMGHNLAVMIVLDQVVSNARDSRS